MSPRRNRPKGSRPAAPDERPLAPEILAAPDGWTARTVSTARATKEYRCPDCNQEVRAGTAHVVAWQHDQDEARRHWHRSCWARFARRA